MTVFSVQEARYLRKVRVHVPTATFAPPNWMPSPAPAVITVREWATLLPLSVSRALITPMWGAPTAPRVPSVDITLDMFIIIHPLSFLSVTSSQHSPSPPLLPLLPFSRPHVSGLGESTPRKMPPWLRLQRPGSVLSHCSVPRRVFLSRRDIDD